MVVMRPKELLLYAAGTIFALAVVAGIVALLIGAVIALPAVAAAFPASIGIGLIVLAVLYLRHRRRQRDARDAGSGER